MTFHSPQTSANHSMHFLCPFIILLFCITHGCIGDGNKAKKLADNTETKKRADNTKVDLQTASLTSAVTKLNGNNQAKIGDVQNECHVEDKDCEKDKLGFDAIRSLHLMIDDDHNGNVDLSESDEFLRDELQYTDGFERQELFHNNDKLISVDDLWKAWRHSTVYNWTVDDVIEWLVQDVDLPQYSQVFHNFAIDGSALPRLVNSTSPLLSTLGIRNPVHKQKLSLKAMDTVLFGAPKRLHNYAKDVMLFMAILLAIGISWFACLHHRYSQTQVKKMMKDLESLQKAEDALKKLSRELADAEKNQISISSDKQDELRTLRTNSLRLQVPRITSGDKSPNHLKRDHSPSFRKEGEIKLKQAEEELATLREALSEAETRLEIKQEAQWSVPGELQAWLQLTHELEQVHFNAKRQAAERQLLAARDGCDKIKRRNKAFFGSLRMAHSNSLDDIDQSILDARAALEEVKLDLQERLHRWHTIELLCGFPVISNPGLSSLKLALGRDTGGSRIPGSLLAPVSIEEADEDLTPSEEGNEFDSIFYQIPERPRQQIFAWARRSQHNSRKKKTLNNEENRESDLYNQIPERQRQQIFAWAHRSRLSSWMKKKTLINGYTAATLPAVSKATTFLKQHAQAVNTLPHASKGSNSTNSGMGHVRTGSRDLDLQGTTSSSASPPVASSANAVIFHVGENTSHHERSHSSASLSLMASNSTNGHHHHHGHAAPRTSHNHSGFNLNAVSSPVTTTGLTISCSAGNLQTGSSLIRASNSAAKIFTSASGNHLSTRVASPLSSFASANTLESNSISTETKHQLNHVEAPINNHVSSHSDIPHGNELSHPAKIHNSSSMIINYHQKNNHFENSDITSPGRIPKSVSSSGLIRSQFDQSLDQDTGSSEAESVQGAPNVCIETTEEKKSSKKKHLLPKFLQKGKKKQKT